MPPVRRQLMPVALFCPQKHLAICPKRVNLDDLREWSPLATAHQEAATKSPLDVEWAGSVWVEGARWRPGLRSQLLGRPYQLPALRPPLPALKQVWPPLELL